MQSSLKNLTGHLFDFPEDKKAAESANAFIGALKGFHTELSAIPTFKGKRGRLLNLYFSQADSYFTNQNRINRTGYPGSLESVLYKK